jgi:hypothetical protein
MKIKIKHMTTINMRRLAMFIFFPFFYYNMIKKKINEPQDKRMTVCKYVNM